MGEIEICCKLHLRILNCNDCKRVGKNKKNKNKTSRAQASEQQLQCGRNIRLQKRDQDRDAGFYGVERRAQRQQPYREYSPDAHFSLPRTATCGARARQAGRVSSRLRGDFTCGPFPHLPRPRAALPFAVSNISGGIYTNGY